MLLSLYGIGMLIYMGILSLLIEYRWEHVKKMMVERNSNMQFLPESHARFFCYLAIVILAAIWPVSLGVTIFNWVAR